MIDDDIDILRKLMQSFFGNYDDEFAGGIKFSDSSVNYSNRDDMDIFSDDNHIYITAELRVPDEDMKITPEKDGLIIEVMQDGSWRRFKKIPISSICNPKSARITYKNGILDVVLERMNNGETNI